MSKGKNRGLLSGLYVRSMVENEWQAESQSTDARGGTQDHLGISAALAPRDFESLARGWLSTVRPVDRRIHVDFGAPARSPMAVGRSSWPLGRGTPGPSLETGDGPSMTPRPISNLSFLALRHRAC